MVVEDIEALLELKQTFESNSVQFTHETGINNKINFLDVHITSEKKITSLPFSKSSQILAFTCTTTASARKDIKTVQSRH